jgi:hypothetical protein
MAPMLAMDTQPHAPQRVLGEVLAVAVAAAGLSENAQP